MKQLYIILLLSVGLFAQYPGRDSRLHNVLWNEFHPATKDSIRQTVSDSIFVIYPIPSDSVSPDTSYVSADSGLGGGGWLELGDSVGVHVNVDSVTIDILDDTLRVDTTKVATHTWASDTSLQIASDSSQYYYWRAESFFMYPDYANAVPWDLGNTNGDSVSLCIFVDSTSGSYRNYQEVTADTNSTGTQDVYFSFHFRAARSIANVPDTLLRLEYITSVNNTDSVGVEIRIYEGSTQRYADSLTASTTWAYKTVLASDVSAGIVSGDRFNVQIHVRALRRSTVPSPVAPWTRLSEFELRYY